LSVFIQALWGLLVFKASLDGIRCQIPALPGQAIQVIGQGRDMRLFVEGQELASRPIVDCASDSLLIYTKKVLV
jgi:hypothetical protein